MWLVVLATLVALAAVDTDETSPRGVWWLRRRWVHRPIVSVVENADAGPVAMVAASSSTARILWPRQVSLRAARALASEACADLSDDVVDDVMLVVSELVTNAMQHGTVPVALAVTLEHGTVLIEVDDGLSAPPVIGSAPSARGGFGLRIVQATSRAWGSAPTAAGKRVWARIASDRAA
jgi:hypothetical protein